MDSMKQELLDELKRREKAQACYDKHAVAGYPVRMIDAYGNEIQPVSVRPNLELCAQIETFDRLDAVMNRVFSMECRLDGIEQRVGRMADHLNKQTGRMITQDIPDNEQALQLVKVLCQFVPRFVTFQDGEKARDALIAKGWKPPEKK